MNQADPITEFQNYARMLIREGRGIGEAIIEARRQCFGIATALHHEPEQRAKPARRFRPFGEAPPLRRNTLSFDPSSGFVPPRRGN